MTTGVETTKVQSVIALIDSLNPGESRSLQDVTWEEYEQLLMELGEHCATRMAYTEGKLEVMAPLYRHEKIKETVSAIVRVLCGELGLRLECAGSTTLRRRELERGAEPDACFYIQHAAVMVGKDTIDLRVDPPPDLVFEVDVTSESRSKMETYARMSVPEFWRYDGARFRIYALSEGGYVASEHSITFPVVTGGDFEVFVEMSQTEGQDSALEALRTWLQEKKPGQ